MAAGLTNKSYVIGCRWYRPLRVIDDQYRAAHGCCIRPCVARRKGDRHLFHALMNNVRCKLNLNRKIDPPVNHVNVFEKAPEQEFIGNPLAIHEISRSLGSCFVACLSMERRRYTWAHPIEG